MISVSHWGLYPAPWYMIADANNMTRCVGFNGDPVKGVSSALGAYDAQYLHTDQPKAGCYQRYNFGHLD